MAAAMDKSTYTKILTASAHTTTFLARSAGRGLRHARDFPEIPTRVVSPGLALSVWIDELVMGFLPPMPEVPLDEIERLSDDVAATVHAYRSQGWLDDPRAFHPKPPAPQSVEWAPRRLGSIRYQQLAFDSDYQPHAALPGAAQWLNQLGSHRVHAFVLRHAEPGRPWLVNLHGYSAGNPFDLVAFRAMHHHRELGYNVIHPVLPLHGDRRAVQRRSGVGFLTLDYVQHLHAFGHAVWDVRRCLEWIRAEGGTSITLHGISLGGMMTALLAALDNDIDRAIAGTPLVDLTRPVRNQVRDAARRAYEQHDLLGDRLDLVHRGVAPLSMECLVPKHGRFVYAGVADRMTTPGEAHRLWTAWGKPPVCWYPGSHSVSGWNREARRFVDLILAGSPF